jgi:hypothetical protein
MVSKKTKISLSLLSLGILVCLTTNALAATYHHEDYIKGITWVPSGPHWNTRFMLTSKLDVTTTSGTEGLVISSWDESWSFWSEKVWIFWPVWEIVERDPVVTLDRLWNEEIIAVKFQMTGRVREIWNHNRYVYLSVWVKIWADGNTAQGHTYWEDHIGFDYFGYPF